MANQASNATAPTVDGKVYHLRLAKGDVPPYVVLPGDQAATEHISAVWQDTKEIAYNREYRTVTGVYEGFDMAMTSTGIGCPAGGNLPQRAQEGGRAHLRQGRLRRSDPHRPRPRRHHHPRRLHAEGRRRDPLREARVPRLRRPPRRKGPHRGLPPARLPLHDGRGLLDQLLLRRPGPSARRGRGELLPARGCERRRPSAQREGRGDRQRNGRRAGHGATCTRCAWARCWP